jgi:hypothetical protein
MHEVTRIALIPCDIPLEIRGWLCPSVLVLVSSWPCAFTFRHSAGVGTARSVGYEQWLSSREKITGCEISVSSPFRLGKGVNLCPLQQATLWPASLDALLAAP